MILLDTHVWVWYAGGRDEISPRAREAIEEAASKEKLWLSSISALEVGQLVAKGRLRLTLDVRDWIQKAERLPGLRIVPVDNLIAAKAISLPPPLQDDPADRIIVATALTLGAALVTRDERLLQYPHVRTLW